MIKKNFPIILILVSLIIAKDGFSNTCSCDSLMRYIKKTPPSNFEKGNLIFVEKLNSSFLESKKETPIAIIIRALGWEFEGKKIGTWIQCHQGLIISIREYNRNGKLDGLYVWYDYKVKRNKKKPEGGNIRYYYRVKYHLSFRDGKYNGVCSSFKKGKLYAQYFMKNNEIQYVIYNRSKKSYNPRSPTLPVFYLEN